MGGVVPVPGWEQMLTPVLQVLDDGEVRRNREIKRLVIARLALSQEQQAVVISSGESMAANRVGWALSYLAQGGAVERHLRSSYRITPIGLQLLDEHPTGMIEKHLRSLPGYIGPQLERPTVPAAKVIEQFIDAAATAVDPLEQIDHVLDHLHESVGTDLLARMNSQDPVFFEQAALDLLMAMGYGGSEGGAARARLAKGGGLEGVIDQDFLGLARLYVRAVRAGAGVGAGEGLITAPGVHDFAEAMAAAQTDRGVFLTTGAFSEAAEQAAREETAGRIILIDGRTMASLMIRHGVGVQERHTVRIVEVDEDYFE
ncbi:winged helix-turn-helix domain-containing protein [Actinomyces slackii]|uniref:EcoKMrr n=2 Tax=Actinomyces slackii TaxID=52774 RepID=A0A448K983_9ACTO|nr:EcoKMrr [Actinomyces slackii]